MLARNWAANANSAARVMLVAAAVFLAAKLGVDLSRLSGNVAAIWIANAIPLGVILLRPRSETAGYIAAAAIGNLVMNLVNGDAVPVAVVFAGCNAGEVLLATVALRVLDGTQILASLRATSVFLAAAAGASTAITAAVGAALVSGRFGAPFWKVWETWWIGDAAGMLFVTPALMAIGSARTMQWPRKTGIVWLTLILAAIATLAFTGFQEFTSDLVLRRIAWLAILPLEILTVVRFGVVGAVTSNLVLCAAGLASIYLGDLSEASEALRGDLGIAQLRMMTYAAMTLALATLLGERSRALARLNSAIDAMHAGFTLTDNTGRLVLVNKQIRSIYPEIADSYVPGARMEDLAREGVAKGIFDLGGRSPEEWIAWRMDVVDSQAKDAEIQLTDGRVLLLSERKDELGETVTIRTDITAQKRQERLLRESEQKLKQSNADLVQLIETCPLAIVSVDRDGTVRSWNGAAVRMFGWRVDEVLGRPLPIVSDAARAEVDALFQREEKGERTVSVDTTRLHKDGHALEVTLWASPRLNAAGEVIGSLGILADVTERKRAEEQLRQFQRLQAVGQLTGGVAHEFNNLLVVMLGNAEVLAHALSAQPQLKERAEYIQQAAERGADLTHRLLAFSRRQPLRPESLDVGEIIHGLTKFAAITLGARIDLHVEIDPDIWRLTSDRAQLESALLNLVINARDAMEAGGTITIRASNAEVGSDEGELKSGRYVAIEVEDTGCGMTAEVLAKAVEPFFTTKGVGKGTGLGLSMVHGFVKQSGGDLRINSRMGAGTIVQLLLPATSAPAELRRDVAVLQVKPRRELTIVVAEDDPLVLSTTIAMLTNLGYHAIGAGDGHSALDLLRRTSRVDVLLSDVIMPRGMTGLDLARRAATVHPNIKVLFMSGYNENVIVHEGVVDRDVVLLRKPFTRSQLDHALSDILRDSSGVARDHG